jgi:hypothetical protein
MCFSICGVISFFSIHKDFTISCVSAFGEMRAVMDDLLASDSNRCAKGAGQILPKGWIGGQIMVCIEVS